MRVRTHGTSGPWVVVLHGGPAAAGEAAPIARGLAERFRVLEPWQRGSGAEPLTVARHIADLYDLIQAQGTARPPAIVGESWGAMLALAYAAAHPRDAGPLILIGCGTFDRAARGRLRATLRERTTPDLRRQLDRLAEEFPDPQDHLGKQFRLMEPIYTFDPLPQTADPDVPDGLDVRAHTETWEDMVRLQEEGVYPQAFSAITSPVLMLHGTYDPHPGKMIRESLAPHIPQLEYREWEACGHSPWRERAIRDEFFTVMRTWLARHVPE